MTGANEANGRRPKRYTEAVLVNLTPEQAARLDEVKKSKAVAEGSRGGALRRVFDLMTDEDLANAPDAAEGKERRETTPEEDAVIAALDARTKKYNELAAQVRALGHQNNTLVKLGHQITKYGATGPIPVAAIQGFQRKVEEVQDQLVALAENDAAQEKAIKSCRF